MPTFLSILLIVAGLAVVFWLLAGWFGKGEDLRVFDHPPEPDASEVFGNAHGPSPEHRQAENEIRSAGGQVRGMSRAQMLQFMREFMEAIPAGRTFDCEFRPVVADGVAGEWVLAPGADPARRVLYIHGGAFIAGSPNSHRTITSRFSAVAGAAVFAVDYRLMPEHRRRHGILDCQAAYRWILENGPDGPGRARRAYLGGDSAGGNLSLVLTAWARDEGLRMPDGVVALSPLTDSAYSGPSIPGNVATDTLLGPLFSALLKVPRPVLTWIFVLQNRFRPIDPLVSPLRGDLAKLPPILLQVSDSEMLLDDARRYVNKARAAGSPARLQIWPGLLHVWQILNPEVPEAVEAFDRIGDFIRSVEAA
ncbi:MAG: alpha/beta hydrolase [Lysobacterales bacterium]